jgi:monolysocardiolipin acyltransferase
MLQALPIWRGGGVDQPLLLDVARRVSSGDWVHVFPEGRVIQSGRLATDAISTRSAEEVARVGRLKWGVGKLLAHAAAPPAVLPWHHRGMAAVLPQNAEWRDDGRGGRRFDNSVKSWVPRAGNRVTVEFGPRVAYCDLIRAHEQARAPPLLPRRAARRRRARRAGGARRCARR